MNILCGTIAFVVLEFTARMAGHYTFWGGVAAECSPLCLLTSLRIIEKDYYNFLTAALAA